MDIIKTKQELRNWIDADLISNKIPPPKTLKERIKVLIKCRFNDRLHFMIILRKEEYYKNNSNSPICKLFGYWYKYRRNKLATLLGFTIAPNSIGKGTRLAHYGSIVINGTARVGRNCVIHSCVNIAENTIIGDNVYIGPGAKIFANLTIADGVKIGANAVVTKSVLIPGVTIVGVPAKIK